MRADDSLRAKDEVGIVIRMHGDTSLTTEGPLVATSQLELFELRTSFRLSSGWRLEEFRGSVLMRTSSLFLLKVRGTLLTRWRVKVSHDLRAEVVYIGFESQACFNHSNRVRKVVGHEMSLLKPAFVACSIQKERGFNVNVGND